MLRRAKKRTKTTHQQQKQKRNNAKHRQNIIRTPTKTKSRPTNRAEPTKTPTTTGVFLLPITTRIYIVVSVGDNLLQDIRVYCHNCCRCWYVYSLNCCKMMLVEIARILEILDYVVSTIIVSTLKCTIYDTLRIS